MDFFGLVTLSATGMFNYKGHFDISLDGQLVLGTTSFGLVANFHFRVAFGERDVVGSPGLTEYFFLVEFSGGAKLRAFGITFAGVNIAASVSASGEGRVPIIVQASAEVEFLFFSVSVEMEFTLGYIELPRNVYLAGNPTGDSRLWDPVAANGVLYLNMGDRNSIRGIAEGAGAELYMIKPGGTDENGDEIVKVLFSGREKSFSGVKKIVAFAGPGDDHLYVEEGVKSDIEFHGGDGNDVVIFGGEGSAILYGDAGDDYFYTAPTSLDATIFGGSGFDYIIHDGRGSATIDGGAGDDVIFGGAKNDIIRGGDGMDEIDGRGGVDEMYGDAGKDLIHWDYVDLALERLEGGTGTGDTLMIYGLPDSDAFEITSLGGSRFKVVNDGAGSIIGKSFEKLVIEGRGDGDTFTVGYLGTSGLDLVDLSAGQEVTEGDVELVEVNGQLVEQPTVITTPDKSGDDILIFGEDGGSASDYVTIEDYDVDGLVGMSIVFSNGSTATSAPLFNPGSAGTTLYTIVVSHSVRAEGDTVTVDTVGGNDLITAEPLNTDWAALTLKGGDDNDRVIGSQFVDVIDTGAGDDKATGGESFDTFIDASGADIFVERFDKDMGLFDDKFLAGQLLNSSGS